MSRLKILSVSRIVAAILLFTVFTGLAAATSSIQSEHPEDILTLESCIQTVLKENVSLSYSKARLRSAAHRIQQARRALYPTMSVFASDNTSLSDSEEFSQYDPSTGQSFVPGEGVQIGANLNYTIYDSSSRQATLNSETDDRDLLILEVKQLEKDLIQETIQAYLSILERKAELTVRNEQITQAEEALRIVKQRLTSGSGIQYEVLLEEAYTAQSQADLLVAENGLEKAQRALLILLRQPPESPVTVQELNPSEILAYSASELMETARLNRLEFQKLELQLNVEKLQLKILRSANKPKLDFFMTYNQQGSDIENISDGDTIWSAGLSLRFSPFANSSLSGSSERQWINSDQFMQKSNLSLAINDGSSTRSQEIDIQINIERLKHQLADLNDQVLNEVLNAYQAYTESLVQLEAKSKNLAAMNENHRIQEKSFELGINQFKDVIDARTDLVSARIALTRSHYTTEQLKINLEYYLGLLNYQELLQ